jgi:hypothetical protein
MFSLEESLREAGGFTAAVATGGGNGGDKRAGKGNAL